MGASLGIYDWLLLTRFVLKTNRLFKRNEIIAAGRTRIAPAM